MNAKQAIIGFLFSASQLSLAASVVGIENPQSPEIVLEPPPLDKKDKQKDKYELDAADRAFPRKRNKLFAQRGDVSDDSSSYDDSSQGIGLSLGIGLGGGTFIGSAAVEVPIFRYLSVSVGGFYLSMVDEDLKETRYGPEAELIVRLHNSTILTPFFGGGVGYETWQRSEKEKEFDSSSSATGIGLAGLSFKMTRSLSLQISSKWITYLDNPPKKFGDHTQYERKMRQSIGLGFILSL